MTVESSWHGDRAVSGVRAGVRVGLQLAADLILARSREVVPYEEGTLSRSSGTDVAGDEASIYYDTAYAIRQHEELGYRHNQGRTAKYLENPLNASRRDVQQIIADQIRRAL